MNPPSLAWWGIERKMKVRNLRDYRNLYQVKTYIKENKSTILASKLRARALICPGQLYCQNTSLKERQTSTVKSTICLEEGKSPTENL